MAGLLETSRDIGPVRLGPRVRLRPPVRGSGPLRPHLELGEELIEAVGRLTAESPLPEPSDQERRPAGLLVLYDRATAPRRLPQTWPLNDDVRGVDHSGIGPGRVTTTCVSRALLAGSLATHRLGACWANCNRPGTHPSVTWPTTGPCASVWPVSPGRQCRQCRRTLAGSRR